LNKKYKKIILIANSVIWCR